MWTVRWAVLCCLLCLAAPSTASCSWQTLQKQELTEKRRQIVVRASEGSGTLMVTLVQQSGLRTNTSTSVSSSIPHTLAINPRDTNCDFTLQQHESHKVAWNHSLLMMEGFKKVEVTGDKFLSESCTETGGKPEAGGSGTNGGDQGGGPDSDDGPEMWVLALIAAGVAVTVASIAVFVWSLCGACKGGSSG